MKPLGGGPKGPKTDLPAPKVGAFAPLPVDVPPRLVQAFRKLGVEPVLVGGSAVQVWARRKDGVFDTHDLDFISSLTISDLLHVGLEAEATGRHVFVDGVPVEFPTGPLAVGDLFLTPMRDAVAVPTAAGDSVLCLRPEGCVIDRLTWVVGDRRVDAYIQARAVAMRQVGQQGWDSDWITLAAQKAGVGRAWSLLASDLGMIPDPTAPYKAIGLGWG